MKYLLLVFTFLLASQARAIPVISLSPSSSTLGFNQAFTVDVLLSGIEATDPLIAFGFDVGSTIGLSYNGAVVASPFLDDSVFFSSTDVAGSTFPAVFGNGILLSTLALTTGASAGPQVVSIFTSQADFGLSEGIFTLANLYDVQATAAIEVVRGSAVPLPSTLLLLSLALLGTGLRKRLATH
ncbi:MAG: PEP-CTERM sorting domain-containing protein [Halioglobus sp.]